MTVNSTANRASYTGNGVTTAFAFPYYFQSSADLVVIETVIATGVQTTRLLTTDYTVTGTQDANGFFPNGGTVNANVAPASTVTWTLYRDPARTQLTQHVDGSSFPAASIDGPLDKLTMIVQRHDDVLARSLRQPDGDTTNVAQIPAAVVRANGGAGSYAGYDGTGQPTVYVPGPAQASVSVAMAPVVTAATLSAGRAALGYPSAAGTLAGENIGQGVEDDGAGNLRVKLLATASALLRSAGGISIDPSFLRGYLAGLNLSNDVGTPNTKLDVSAGVCADDTNAMLLKLAAGVIDFTVNGLNGLDTGAIAASTWYHIYAISKADGSAPGFLASTSVSAPTFPATYTLKRRLGSVKTDASSHLLAFKQQGDDFLWAVASADQTAVTPSTVSRTLYTLAGVPLGVQVEANITIQFSSTAAAAVNWLITSPDETDQAISSNIVDSQSPASNSSGARFLIRTSTAQQIGVRASSASATFSIGTRGWKDTRGRFN